MEGIQPSTFGELLKVFRKQQQITQHELAARIGAHRNTIGIWERGDFLPESKTIVLELAHQLCLDMNDTRRLLEASLTALSPYWQMPYQRNPFFTGREEVLQQLHDAFTHECSPTVSQSYALCGLGGIGKTQIAIEYAYRYANDYAAIFWISAETDENIISSMITIAIQLNLPEKQEQSQEKVVAAVIHWLTNHRDWLLVFDNVEDSALVKRFLPAARYGSLLFTSRKQALGLTARTLDLGRMTLEEGMHFLLRRARSLDPTEKALAQEIVVAMDGLPLALDQAGAYIESTRCSLSDYLRLFQSSHLRLLDERDIHMDHPLPVTKTFALAFEQLKQNNASAAELLTVCAFLAPEAIPEMFFTEGAADLGPTFEMLVADPLQLHAAIKALLSYSLLQRHATTKTVTVHRLVQAVLRGSLSEASRRIWAGRVAQALTRLFPSDEKTQTDYWQSCERLLPHALVCLTFSEQWNENELLYITLMNRVATYLSHRARFDEAKTLYEQVLSIAEQTHSSEQSQVAEALYGLATLYSRQGKYAQAKSLHEQALSIWEQILGSEHPQVATSLNNLAILYRRQGHHKEAERLHTRALRIREQAFGPEHPHVASSLINLAIVYFDQGHYEEAEQLFKRALCIWEQVLSPEHPNMAYALNNLAGVYKEQGRYDEAKPLSERAVGMWEETLGSQHPHVASSLDSLAEIYYEQGKYEEAEPLHQRALSIMEHAWGPEHPQITNSLIGLANLYREQCKYEQARPLYQRALTIRQQHLDLQHPEFAEILHHFARFHQKQQQSVEALSLYRQALTIRESALGPDHPKTKETQSEYIQLLEYVERGKEMISEMSNEKNQDTQL